MSTLTLAHISDLHLPFVPRLTLRQHLSKRQLSVWSFRRRGHNQSATILDRLRADIQHAAVDHIVITGDITNFSLPGEFAAAARWLTALAPAEHVSLVPGNHDQLVHVAPRDGLDRWAPWIRLDSQGWPFVHVLGMVSLIGVNTAIPTPPLLARGRVGQPQLVRLQHALQRNIGHCRIVLMHHPIADGVVNARKALADRGAVRAVLARAGAELVLYGHARDAHVNRIPGPRGPIPCICVPSSSALPNPHDEGARWNQLSITDTSAGWDLRLRTRRWSESAGDFVDGGAIGYCLPAVTATRSARRAG